MRNYWASILIWSFTFNTASLWAQNNSKLVLTQLNSRCFVFTTFQLFKGNPISAHGMYIITDSSVVLFDTPWDTSQFQPLLDSIWKKHEKNVSFVISTHSHEDRTAGLEFYKNKGARTYTSFQTDSISKTRGEKRATYLFYSDTVFSIDNIQFSTYFPGHGHTPDNILLYLAQDEILYGGCFIKSVEAKNLGNLADASPKDWLNSVKRVIKKYPNCKHIITGHQGFNSTHSLQHTQKLCKLHLKGRLVY